MGEQPRERSVPCLWCKRPTWNTDAVCDRCQNRTEAASDEPEMTPWGQWKRDRGFYVDPCDYIYVRPASDVAPAPVIPLPARATLSLTAIDHLADEWPFEVGAAGGGAPTPSPERATGRTSFVPTERQSKARRALRCAA